MATVAMFVTNTLLMDNRVIREATVLAKDGWDVHLVSYLPPSDAEEARRLLPATVVLHHASPSPWKGKRYEWLKKPLQVADIVHWGGGYALEQAARHIRADVYHANDLDTLAVAARFAKSHHARLVFDSHELFVDTLGQDVLEPERLLTRLKNEILKASYRRIERTYLPQADVVFTVSEGIAEKLSERYRIVRPKVLMNCPQYQDLTPGSDALRHQLGFDADERIVLYQGGLGAGRGLLPMLDAMVHLPQRYHHVLLGFDLGSDTMRRQIRRRVTSLGLSDRVHYLPAVPGSELLQLTASADIGALLIEDINLSKRFALPNKLFEYLMAGLPILATNLPELKKMAERTGAIQCVDSLEPTLLADNIRLVVENRAHHKSMRTAGLRWARESLRWSIQAEILKSAYRSLRPD